MQDEPFYAPYLARTGPDHPLRDQILATHEVNPDRAVAGSGGGVIHLKLMAHHMAGMPLDWAKGAVLVRRGPYLQRVQGPGGSTPILEGSAALLAEALPIQNISMPTASRRSDGRTRAPALSMVERSV